MALLIRDLQLCYAAHPVVGLCQITDPLIETLSQVILDVFPLFRTELEEELCPSWRPYARSVGLTRSGAMLARHDQSSAEPRNRPQTARVTQPVYINRGSVNLISFPELSFTRKSRFPHGLSVIPWDR